MKIHNGLSIWRRVARGIGGRLFHWAENNGVADVCRNGEAWLVREVMRNHLAHGDARPLVIVDGGANAGDYTAMLLNAAAEIRCPIEVHAFEPSVKAQGWLQNRFKGSPAVRLVGKAMGDHIGEGVLLGQDGSSLASLVERPSIGTGVGHAASVSVTTLEAYLAEAGVGCVGLLKLDVEGYELLALRGLGKALTPGRVKLIQFEYGGTTLDAGVTLREIHQLLEERGYRVGKLLPRGIVLRDYAPWMEHFNYANYVAVAPGETE